MNLSTPDFPVLIAAELQMPAHVIKSIIELLDHGSTVPFIARYRKEATGGAEDVTV